MPVAKIFLEQGQEGGGVGDTCTKVVVILTSPLSCTQATFFACRGSSYVIIML